MDYRRAGNDVMETEVLTASPAKLRRMTVEFALRNVNQAIEQAAANGGVQKSEATLNLRDALTELLGGIRPSEESLSKQVADMYVFLLQWLTAAELDGDREKLVDIGRVLEIELDTWNQVVTTTISESSYRSAGGDDDSLDSICFDA
ncbi:flagellar protein FliS [Rosistilla oblonga]|uniref:Flagellar protein FliS n=1 Tax=Rosistilla oblonga TaxID=2527990 RepID=A0A518IR46_9BACT|nr:flagellar export chaperone FliS [Rosistilla oblonga]QDV11568.1 flagellar protein FliS [Rosistilla oblonga]QDV55559.1 flagellar protein FliS [Rosistilla oblonga]